jgi:putative oxidoreductase
MKVGSLALRSTIGPLFVGHGTQKLFGWFDGHGPEGTGGFFESLGLRPGRRHATAAGWAEAAGGALVTLGALTPLAGSALTATMVTAIRKVHAKNGPWSTNGGYEYNVVVIAALMALTENGPGRPSADSVLFPRMKGATWALLQLGAGIAASYLATSERFNGAAEQGPAGAADDLPGDPAVAEDEPRFTREQAAEPAATGR